MYCPLLSILSKWIRNYSLPVFFLMQATEKKNQLPKLQKKKALIKLSKEEINSQHISSLEFTNQKTC